MAEQKNFINGAFVRVHHFPNGGFVVNADVNVDTFIEQLQAIKDEKGFAHITFAERQNPVDGKPNGYCYENTFKPKAQAGSEGGKPAYETPLEEIKTPDIEF